MTLCYLGPYHNSIKSLYTKPTSFIEMNIMIVVAIFIILSVPSHSSPFPALRQTNTSCNIADCLSTCADPALPREGDCCPSCDNSTCLFKGCVHWNSFGVQWFPEPCTMCSCQNGHPSCSQLQCQLPACFGFPAKTVAGQCCAECDFGIATNSCGPVPDRKVIVSVTTEDGSCVTDVLMHKCDKSIVVQNGRTYACSGVQRNVSIKMTNCFAQRVVYKDVVQCTLKPLPVFDYDPAPYSCQLYIP